MDTELGKSGKPGPDNLIAEILELYERASESARMDIYMTYRELRDRFERIEASPTEISWS